MTNSQPSGRFSSLFFSQYGFLGGCTSTVRGVHKKKIFGAPSRAKMHPPRLNLHYAPASNIDKTDLMFGIIWPL